jgi:hypothetical protein
MVVDVLLSYITHIGRSTAFNTNLAGHALTNELDIIRAASSRLRVLGGGARGLGGATQVVAVLSLFSWESTVTQDAREGCGVLPKASSFCRAYSSLLSATRMQMSNIAGDSLIVGIPSSSVV